MLTRIPGAISPEDFGSVWGVIVDGYLVCVWGDGCAAVYCDGCRLYTRVAGGDAQAVWKALQAAESGYRAKGRAPVRLMDRELITAPVEFDWAKYFDAE